MALEERAQRPTQQFDDNYFGPPLEEKPARYTGGYNTDPKTGGGFDANFEKIKDSELVKVKFLPKDLAAQQKRMGRFDPNPNAGDERPVLDADERGGAVYSRCA